MALENFSRRTVAKGAAWGVPVVAIGASAPAMAASLVPSVKGASYYSDNYLVGRTSTTIDALIQPTASNNSCSYTVTNGPATVSNLSMTYWLPVSNYKFTSAVSSPWTVLAADPSKGTKVGPSTGLTFYPYTTTYAGTGSAATTCGPTYSFTAPAVTTNITNPGGANYYQFSYSLNGTAKSNPLQAVNNP